MTNEALKLFGITPTSISEQYPGQLSLVDKIILLDGSTGETKTVEDKSAIQGWLNRIKLITLYPDENQEDRSGFRFRISLYEGESKKLGFIATAINGVYYQPNEQLYEYIRSLFEEQFGRTF
ncbi:hypothetical protein M6D81_30385 [Paenibacillus sp. J5C_2022]|nr:hypothetical protein [Paenibacillus sp. J5C2022]